MQSRILIEERLAFARRLKFAAKSVKISTDPAEFLRAYNARADGATVTSHAVRKWFNGEAFPTHEKLQILAGWFAVSSAWLRFGDDNNEPVPKSTLPESAISTSSLLLIRDIDSLPLEMRVAIVDLVATLKKTYGKQSG